MAKRIRDDQKFTSISFWHESCDPQWLEVEVGPNNIGWSYVLNTAKFPTYGGEVVQILSVYIGDITITGEVRSYKELEKIYKYFVQYMTLASQGSQGTGSYIQTPMHMHYHERNWLFHIQPFSAPGFAYSRETIAPKWQITAHVKDETTNNYAELEDLVAKEILNSQAFKLEGIISLSSADPEQNPFAAPVTASGNEFLPYTIKKQEQTLHEYADYYNTLLPSYLSGDYSPLLKDSSKPAFGNQAVTQKEFEKTEKEGAAKAQEIASREQRIQGNFE